MPGCGRKTDNYKVNLPYSSLKPLVIHVDLPAEEKGVGGIITADITDDGRRDFIITKPAHIVAYDQIGEKLWSKKINIQVTGESETYGLPGWHGPGVQAADVDGDQKTEVLFLTKDNTLNIVQGSSGMLKWRVKLESPHSTERWEHLVIANFRGEGDRDLLLQATNAEGYRMGRYIAAYPVDGLMKSGKAALLWNRDDFIANAHSGVRVADLDGDGKDEVLGGTVLDPDGDVLFEIPLKGHVDSIFVDDIRPEISGLEVLALEEGGGRRVFANSNRIFRISNRIVNRLIPGGNHTFLYNQERLIWKSNYKHREPQNAAIGEFDQKIPGLEIWCRSRYDSNQKPFLFDAMGDVLATYEMSRVAPKGWTNKGVEIISPIHWTGAPTQLLAAKERGKSGDVAIFNPISGEFLHRFKEKADRLYVADVSGDWREELIVLSGNELHIYQNQEPNPNTQHPRLWTQNHYRRSKMTWNYYNP